MENSSFIDSKNMNMIFELPDDEKDWWTKKVRETREQRVEKAQTYVDQAIPKSDFENLVFLVNPGFLGSQKLVPGVLLQNRFPRMSDLQTAPPRQVSMNHPNLSSS